MVLEAKSLFSDFWGIILFGENGDLIFGKSEENKIYSVKFLSHVPATVTPASRQNASQGPCRPKEGYSYKWQRGGSVGGLESVDREQPNGRMSLQSNGGMTWHNSIKYCSLVI